MNAYEFNKNFIKDLKLPIAVDKDPYFTHYLNLTDPYYDSVEKYKIFVDTFEANGREQFFDVNRRLVNGTLDYLKDKEAYQVFNALDMSQFKKEIPISSQDLYKSQNANKRFISIDLVKANFQSLLMVVPEIFDGYQDYKSFALSRGFNDYMLISKQIRQILFGNMNPQRQQKIQYFMMNQIAEKLLSIGVNVKSVYSLSSDELIFEKDHISVSEIQSAIASLGYTVRVEEFVLRRPFDKPFYVKESIDGKLEFKMVPTSMMAEFIKRLENRPLEEIDMYFYDENKRLSKFAEPFI